MQNLLWTVPVIPLISFAVLATQGKRFSRMVASVIGVGSVGLSAAIALGIAFEFFGQPAEQAAFTQTLWNWISVGGFAPDMAFRLDALSLLMMLVVTVVGFLIHLYSVGYMADDKAFSRFFAYMNLFVSFMLILVLGDNLALLLVGWEGVGLCSYLLIGFWYSDAENGSAARKAFVVTRIGDTALLIGLFLLFRQFGTLNIQDILLLADAEWTVGNTTAIAIAALLLGGAVGKSAQLPLQTWLPDAMAGPTPVSALIHAATMVTAGVYLIARTHVIFDLAPVIRMVVAIVGAATLLLAGLTALTQRDIKRVLAYSTISQIGYMFLALGVGAYSAAMFHFMTHAFFKALLFLGAGAVILAMHHEQDMFKMGGLRTKLPVTFWTFLIGSASLAAIPLVTAGFYSKDAILWYAYASDAGSTWLWLAGLVGAFITAVYTFRMVFVTFYGKPRGTIGHSPGKVLLIPLVALAVLSTIGGFIETPATLGHVTAFSSFVHATLPAVPISHVDHGIELLFQVLAVIAALGGVFIAWLRYYRTAPSLEAIERAELKPLWRASYSGFGFDAAYRELFVRPYYWIANVNRSDFIDYIYIGLAGISRGFSRIFRLTQTGRLRTYATGLALGAVVTIVLAVFL